MAIFYLGVVIPHHTLVSGSQDNRDADIGTSGRSCLLRLPPVRLHISGAQGGSTGAPHAADDSGRSNATYLR